MSKLNELLAELCPDGVEYKTLGELGSFYGGLTGKSKEDFTEGNVKFITYMNVFSNLEIDINSLNRVKVGGNERQNAVLIGDVLFTGSSETPDACGMSSVLISELDAPIYLNSFCFGFRFNDRTLFLPEFSKYLFRSDSLRKQIGRTASGVTRFNVSKEKMKKVIAPLPPLPIQSEIVRILDSFTELTAELTAELAARKKQYEYYRDALLTFAETGTITTNNEQRTTNNEQRTTNNEQRTTNNEQRTTNNDSALIKLCQYVFGYARIELNNIGKVSMCKRIMKAETSANGDVPFFKIGTFGGKADAYISKEQYEKYKTMYPYPNKGDVLISAAGTTGRTVIYNGKPAYYQDSNIVWIANDESIVLNKYLFYCYQLQPWAVSTGGTIARLYNNDIAKAKINVPVIEEQKRIVAILDRFDTLCNDISAGLPAEIEARRKQYEYYRDKLLSFTRLPDGQEER